MGAIVIRTRYDEGTESAEVATSGTVDHINTITSIIETRKKCKLSTYVAFIDFKNAYDSINRALSFNKLENLGISLKFMFALKGLYSNIECSVRLNGNMTDWFNVDSGLKQGCILSFSMFNIYVNSLIDDINALNIGIDIDNEKLAILLYADDVVLLTENEKDLQKIMDVFNFWCTNNALYVNVNKFNIMHFRNPSVPRTDFNFTVNGNSMECVNRYQYLGLLLT